MRNARKALLHAKNYLLITENAEVEGRIEHFEM